MITSEGPRKPHRSSPALCRVQWMLTMAHVLVPRPRLLSPFRDTQGKHPPQVAPFGPWRCLSEAPQPQILSSWLEMRLEPFSAGLVDHTTAKPSRWSMPSPKVRWARRQGRWGRADGSREPLAQERKESSRLAGRLALEAGVVPRDGRRFWPQQQGERRGPRLMEVASSGGLEKAHQPWGSPFSDRDESVPCNSPALSCCPVSFLALLF